MDYPLSGDATASIMKFRSVRKAADSRSLNLMSMPCRRCFKNKRTNGAQSNAFVCTGTPSYVSTLHEVQPVCLPLRSTSDNKDDKTTESCWCR
ncbi:hypothetical protein T12_16306 [Trichinella patagoniensis]|uniref:Uncharacterized protein n=1 Tax=Trichinella patagoniensis TaxID=990121 RepID=A0A0V0Z5P9_9BILA|nr:hypothetical protein T12_16306 [Trichinella patagoniensis]